MSDSHDDLSGLEELAAHRGSNPDEWLGAPDPVQRFSSTIERALQELAQELAGIRAERDGLRLELEGLRAQFDVVRAQLDERERFSATVRELGEIVRNLNVPPAWREPAAPPEPPVAEPRAEPETPAEVEPEPDPFVMLAPATAPPEPKWSEPAPTVSPAPAPSAVTTPVASPADTFFDEPGTWLGEPPARTKKRSGWLKKTAVRVGAVLAALVVLVVLLISVGPKVAPYQTYFVRSGSMEPTFNTGDLIVLTKVDASDIKKGDIITFERPDKPGTLVTHRVVGIETTKDGRQFQTKGDANGSADAWRVPANGKGWKYKFHIAKVGFVFGYLSTPAARLALLAIPAVLLGLLSLIDIWKPQPKRPPTRSR